jgi:hypothetical protein
MPSSDALSPDNSGDGSQRLTWPEVAALTVVVAFDIFLMWRGLTAQAATITAVTTAAAVLGLLVLPRRVTEVIKQLHAISRFINRSGSGDVGS